MDYKYDYIMIIYYYYMRGKYYNNKAVDNFFMCFLYVKCSMLTRIIKYVLTFCQDLRMLKS